MTWFKVDDEWANHPKVRRAGLHGRGLWMVAGSMCASRNTDGLVEELMVRDYVYFAEVDGDVAIPALVTAGLWHDAKTLKKCDRCRDAVGRLPEGAFYFHDWIEYQFTKDEAKVPEWRRRKMRAKALNRDQKLKSQILDRDGTLCRYCGIRVDFRDRRSPYGGTYDHVDPDGDNTFENVVVACRDCNTRKGERTPEEAGMPLLEPGTVLALTRPGPESDLAGARSRSDRDQTGIKPDLASRGRDARTGPDLAGARSDQAGAKSGSGRGRNRARSGRNGDGPGRAPAASAADRNGHGPKTGAAR